MESTATEATETAETTAPGPPDAPAGRPVIPSWLQRFLHVLIEPRSYLNALYMLVAFPLGLTYFGVLLLGGVVGAILAPVLVGLLILLATLVAAWGFALIERELAIWLLGANVAPLSLPEPEVISPFRMLARHLRRSSPRRLS